ncbi:MAG: hypothetical protein KA714_26595 [Limnoraphis sp. WC205]|nr:hypothetical protein [Limnoraphis sp. WC205]
MRNSEIATGKDKRRISGDRFGVQSLLWSRFMLPADSQFRLLADNSSGWHF